VNDHADPIRELTRRHFLRHCGVGLGGVALTSLLDEDLMAGVARERSPLGLHHAPRAKNVIFLFMAGGPSQLELFEPKPVLGAHDGEVVPPSVTAGKRFAFIQPDAKLMATRRRFERHGECGAPFSELLPHTAAIADQLCFLRGMQTDEINHGPQAVRDRARPARWQPRDGQPGR
jgi:hypothetical protein